MEILSRKLKKKSVIYTLKELVLTFLRNPKKTREKSFTEDNIFFFNSLQLPDMGSGNNGVHVQKHVVILVWRELEDEHGFVK